MSTVKKKDILNDPDFQQLARQKNTISLVLTVLQLLLYFGFIYLVAEHKDFLSQKMSEDGAATIGIPIAVGTIILSWIFTGIYIWWANTRYDEMVRKVVEKVGG
jgi:uncharacterized membrane protein (DUF485 family)